MLIADLGAHSGLRVMRHPSSLERARHHRLDFVPAEVETVLPQIRRADGKTAEPVASHRRQIVIVKRRLESKICQRNGLTRFRRVNKSNRQRRARVDEPVVIGADNALRFFLIGPDARRVVGPDAEIPNVARLVSNAHADRLLRSDDAGQFREVIFGPLDPVGNRAEVVERVADV